MGNIFISYSHKDSKYVRELEKDIRQKGFDVWIDERIDYGTEWPKVIQNHLDECDAFIVVVSENSFTSLWVQNEAARAQRKGKPFFPLLLSGDPWLSTETTQYVDVRDGKLPPPKFYQRLSTVTTRVNKISAQLSDEQPNLKTVKILSKSLSSELRKRFSFSRKQLIFGIPIIFVVFATIFILSYLSFNKIPSPVNTATVLSQEFFTRPVPTVDPSVTTIIKVLNSDLSTNSPLGWVIDAQYHVVNVTFPNDPTGPDRIAQINVTCICMNDTSCCTPERTFVEVIESMRRSYPNISDYLSVFDGVREFTVMCNDYQTNTYIGAVSVAWQDIRNYLQDPSQVYELGGNIRHKAVP